ncbi:CvpA family protein [Rhodobium gokarnense]|uniref:Membrane protein required for colicin V production n=1 Tax=Rhodobium gokarnense TaxID=364296 RepID=A0ABT3HFH2_9HYPH|nr:CvpA family protein [Rhodobium gokarnense]MCW2309148.1 membrane protein required for colicin V production [Rhodobium gokarnense]
MPITIFDGLLIFVMLISALLAMIRGFVREVLSIASWAIAFVVAILFYKQLVPFAKQYINHDMVAQVAAGAAIFLVTLIVVSYITMRVSDYVLDSRIGALDRTLGFVFGAVRGLLLVVVAMLFFNWAVPPETQPRWVASAKSMPLLNSIGQKLIAALPEDPERKLLDRLRNRGRTTSTTPAAEGAEADQDANYRNNERQGLDQLIQSTDGTAQ